eukprot:7330428-Ditylum_brightwellii.AAC.1
MVPQIEELHGLYPTYNPPIIPKKAPPPQWQDTTPQHPGEATVTTAPESETSTTGSTCNNSWEIDSMVLDDNDWQEQWDRHATDPPIFSTSPNTK